MGGKYSVITKGDINNYVHTGLYQCIGNPDILNTAWPTGHILKVIRASDYVFQVAINAGECVIKVRTTIDRPASSYTWTEWKTIIR